MSPLDIRIDAKEFLDDLVRLNEIWIRDIFGIEAVDRQLASDPEAILRQGGHTLTALLGGKPVGVVALFASEPGAFELARMAVDPEHRGLGIGRKLVEAALSLAEELGAVRVFLLSNSRLVPAISLYRSVGFETVQEGTHPQYSRCNVVMEKRLGA